MFLINHLKTSKQNRWLRQTDGGVQSKSWRNKAAQNWNLVAKKNNSYIESWFIGESIVL